MFCTYCGTKLVANAAACSACGEPTSVTATTMLGTDATRLGTDGTRLGTSSDATHLGSSPDAMTSLGTGSAHAPQFGTRPSAVATLTPPGVPVTPGSPLAPGTAFGSRYHIIRLLGMGGMGAVYQAWDDELGVAVALKVIRPEITADPASARDLERRFKRELLLARQVTHKNVVRIHDLGEIDGIKYITMPYIQGSDLGSVLSKQGKLPVGRAVAIAKQVVGGLVAAHEAGVVHRDLKPANIMIDEDDQAVIMDFGIARSVSGGGATVAGAVVGTLEYMAPEQAMARPVDQRADVYAFGLILYDMVLGPRQATRAESAVAELMQRVQNPLPPARGVDPSIPEPLERIIDKCTQPDPAARYQTSAQLAQDLELLDNAGRPTSSTAGFNAPPITRTSTPAVVLPKARSVPLKAVVAAVAVLALAVAGWLLRDRFSGGGSGGGAAAGKPVALAVIPLRNATGNSSLDWVGTNLSDMILGSVGQSPRLRPVGSGTVAPLLRDLRIRPDSDIDPGTIKNLVNFTNADRILVGRFVKLGEQIRIEAFLHGGGSAPVAITASAANEAELPATAQAIATEIQKNLSLTESEVKDLQAAAFKPSSQSMPALRYYSQGVQFEAVGEHIQAAKSFEESTKADANFALAYSKLAQSLGLSGRASEAESASRTAARLSENLPAEEKDLILAAHARFMNDVDKAVDLYGRLLARRPNDVQLRLELAALLERKGALDRAGEEYKRVLELEPKHVEALYAAGRLAVKRGDANASIDPLNTALSLSIQLDNREAKAKIMQALGNVYSDLGKTDDALKQYRDSLAIKEQIGDRRGVSASLNSIAQIYESQGKTADAEAAYRESVRIRREIGDREGLGIVLISLGASYLDSGRYDDALTTFKEALQLQRDLGNEDRQARCLSNIGNVYQARAEYDEARTYLERALELREKGKIPGNIAITLASLASVSTRLGDYERAQTQFLRAIELWRNAGDKRGAAVGSLGLAVLFEQRGRYAAAVESSSEALKTFRELQERSASLVEALVAHGSALSGSGRFADAEKSLAEALTLARELRIQTLAALALNAQGQNAYYRGDMNAARTSFEQARQAATGAGHPYYMLVSQVGLARLAVEARPQSAIADLTKLVAEADRLGLKQVSAESSTLLAEAMLKSRNAAGAIASAQTAVVTAERLEARGILARAHFLLGEAQRTAGKTDQAAAEFGKARQVLAEMQKESPGAPLTGRYDLTAIEKAAGQ